MMKDTIFFPLPDKKCLILTPAYGGEEPALMARRPGDLLLCADAGWLAAQALGLQPDLIIGDFDSLGQAPATHLPVEALPTHKDDTDLAVCIRAGRARGYRRFLAGDALGGRVDLTLCSLQLAADCALRGEQLWLISRENLATVLAPGDYVLPRREGWKLSLLAMTPTVEGVTLHGTEWPLEGAALSQLTPLGVSNEWVAAEASLSFRRGLLAVLYAAPGQWRRM